MTSTTNAASIGNVSAGMHLPEPVLTVARIAAETGLPGWVVSDKLGTSQKHMAGPDDHPNEMAIKTGLDYTSRPGIPLERSMWCCARLESGASAPCGRWPSFWCTSSERHRAPIAETMGTSAGAKSWGDSKMAI